MMSRRIWQHLSHWGAAHWVAVALFGCAIPFLFAQLGTLPLWEDEAHTALLARSILRTGLPLLWDGTNLLSGVNGEDIGPYWLLTWDGPLQFYCTALAFRFFGESEFTARLPFVLAALATLPLLFCLARRITRNAWIGVGSMALLCTSVPFLTHARQCRYYALSIFFGTLMLYGYWGLRERRRDLVYFVLGGVALFYANPFALIVIWSCTALHCGVVGRAAWRRFALGSVLIALPAFPWFVFAELYGKRGPARKPGLAQFFYLQIELLYKFNRFLFPLVLWPLLLACRRRLTAAARHWVGLALLLYLASILGIALLLPPASRYAIWFLPIAAICGMLLVAHAWQRARSLGVVCLALFLGTNLFVEIPTLAVRTPLYCTRTNYTVHRREPLSTDIRQALRKTYGRFQFNNTWYFQSGHWWKSLGKLDLAAYWHAITRPYRDPIAGVTAFLRAHAAPGDEAFIAVDGFALMYYLPWLRQAWMVQPKLANWRRLQSLPPYVTSYERIRWFVPRLIKKMKGPQFSETAFIQWAYRRGLPFRRHVLDDYLIYDWDGSRPETIEQYTRQHSDAPRPGVWADRPVIIYEVLRPETPFLQAAVNRSNRRSAPTESVSARDPRRAKQTSPSL